MSSEQRRTVRTITTTHSSSSYGTSSSRSALGYWIPLALTVTAATVGLAAWIWSERDDAEESSESEAEHFYASGGRPAAKPHHGGLGGAAAAAAGAAGLGAAAGYTNMSGGLPPGPGPAGQQPPLPGSFAPGPPAQGGFQGPPPGQMPPVSGGEAATYFRDEQSRTMSTGVTTSQQDQGFIARVSNAVGLTRTDTPTRVNQSGGGGWATSAISMVEGAVNAVRGSAEGEQHFSDQEKWSEEADKPERAQSMSPRKSAGSLGAGVGLGAAAGAGAVAASRSLQRQGTAQEFYSGAVEAPVLSSVTSRKRRTVAVVVSSVEKGDDGLEVDAHQVCYAPACLISY